MLIGSGCLISDTDSHPIDWEDRLYDRNEKTRKAPIVIKDNAFIGARSIILKGVTIGEGAVVGAVVSKNTPPYSIVGGIPAKVIKFYWTIDVILKHESQLYPENERYSREELEEIFREY